MKSLKIGAIALGIMAVSFTSCKEKKTEAETLKDQLEEEGATIEESTDDDGNYKMKAETPDGDEVKIKVDEDGTTKIKTDDN